MSVRKIQRNQDVETQGYKGVFKGVSENLNVGIGKLMPSGNVTQKEHHFNIGWKPWQQSNETVYEVDYNPKPITREPNFADKHKPSIAIAHSNVPYNKQTHFTAEYSNFKAYPDSRPAKPIKDKTAQRAAQIVLGDDRLNYQTTQVYSQQAQPAQRELKYHEKPQRFDIITNNNVDTNLLQKASSFDYWNPNKDKSHQSANHCIVPNIQMGRRDPITNRLLY